MKTRNQPRDPTRNRATPSPVGHRAPRIGDFLVHTGDCLSWLDSLPDGCVDLVLTDYAYESLEKHRKRGTTTRLKQSTASSNPWFPIFPNRRVPTLMRQLYRVLGDDRHCYLLGDQETVFDVVKPAAIEAGFRFWKALIWDKKRLGMGYHYRARHECIAFLEKGKRRLQDLSVPDVLAIPSLRGRDCYPTEKPVGLARVLITQSTAPCEIVLDPFCGSGWAGVAANASGRHAVLCDVLPVAIKRTERRLRELGARLDPGLLTRKASHERRQLPLWHDERRMTE